MRLTLLVAVLGVLAIGCRSDDPPNNGDDAPPVDAPPGTTDTRIQDIQSDTIAIGTAVTVKGVVVTAIDAYGARTGDIWVQEPDGGEFSGVKVFGAPLEQVATLAVGDVVDISGAEKDEFSLDSDMSGRKVTELKPISGGMMTVTKVTSGTAPAPAMVDGAAIANLATEAERDAEWEKWEGVLITVTNIRQTTDVVGFGTSGADDAKEFEASGGIAVQTVLSAFPDTAVTQTCYMGITGVGDYFFNYLLLPRSPDDLVTGGTGCQVAQTVTISEIQAGTATGPVEIKDVFVSAVSFNKKNFWITTSLAAAPNEGVYVFRGNGMSVPVLDAGVVAGAKVDISGTAVEGNNDQMGDTNTQITGPTITVVAAPAGQPTPVTGQMASALVAPATGEPYESVMVTLTKVLVVDAGDSMTFGVGQLQQGTTMFLSDDDILRLLPADETKCFDFVGMWTYQVFSNAYGLLPISKTEVSCL